MRKFDELYKTITESLIKQSYYDKGPGDYEPQDNPYEQLQDEMSEDGEEYTTYFKTPFELNGKEVFLMIYIAMDVYPYFSDKKDTYNYGLTSVRVFPTNQYIWKEGEENTELEDDPRIHQLVKEFVESKTPAEWCLEYLKEQSDNNRY